MQSNQPEQHVEIKVVTWEKDSHGLFDYESKSIQVKKFKIEQSSKIFRNDLETQVINLEEKDPEVGQDKQKDKDNPSKFDFMTSIIKREHLIQQQTGLDNFYLNPKLSLTKSQLQQQQQTEQGQENFLIVRSLKNSEGQQKGYVLSPGDIIKLGRIEYLVHEISTGENIQSIQNCSPQSELHHTYEVKDEEINQSRMVNSNGEPEPIICRICLMDDQDDDNFFISPCICKGSCKYVHFQCLKTWVESKIKRKIIGSTVTYNWKKSDCELCNHPLPKKIKKKGEEKELVQIERPQCPYLLLESLARDKKVSKSLFLITQVGDETDQTCLGRGHQCEVRISDISVSRQHAFIKYQDGNFVIKDNNSKFGTLIKLANPIPITKDKVAVQVGRTVITVVLRNGKKDSEQQQQVQQQTQVINNNQVGTQIGNLQSNKPYDLNKVIKK